MNDDDNEDWWAESYWMGSKYESEWHFLRWFGNWLVEVFVGLLFLTEAILYIFHFLNTLL
jgi:hypothetical protein